MTIDKILCISKGYVGIIRNKVVEVQDVCNKGRSDDDENDFQVGELLHEAIPWYGFESVLFCTDKRFLYIIIAWLIQADFSPWERVSPRIGESTLVLHASLQSARVTT